MTDTRTSSTRRPNIVIFMTDQQRGTTVLPGQRDKAITPHVDALRAEGVTFGRCLTVAPHCCPSRASFLTGRYPSEHGVWNNVHVANALSRGPWPGTPFWSRQLQDAGYRLGFTGKWHVSNTEGPADHGWQEGRITGAPLAAPGSTPGEQRAAARERDLAAVHAAVPTDPPPPREPGQIVRPGYPTYRHYGTDEDAFGDAAVVDSAIEFISEASAQPEPWVLYVGTLGPHDPYRPPQRFLDLYDPDAVELPDSFTDPMHDKPALYRRTRDRFDQLTVAEHREALWHYLAFCSYQDDLFGRVRGAVQTAGAAADTVFVYTSDHGDYAGEHGLWCKGLPSFEAGVHIPLVIGGEPIEGAGRTVDSLVSIVDIGPTLLDLCGLDPAGMSGVSLADVLAGSRTGVRTAAFTQSNGNELLGIQRSIVTDEWKLVFNGFDQDELYHRPSDPDEMVNLLHRPDRERQVGTAPLAEVPDTLRPVVADLYARLWAHALAHDDDLVNPYIMTALASHGPLVAERHTDPKA